MTRPPAAAKDWSHARQRELVDAHFGGRISPRHERALRGHLIGCGECRDYYERHLHLGLVDPVSAPSSSERLARGLGLSRRTTSRWGWSWLAVAACAAIAVLALQGRRSSGLEPRGATVGGQLLIYEIPKGSAPRPVSGEMSIDSALAFAYTNIGHKARLMVFAVDENRRTYWYHPAWPDAAATPTAVDIEPDARIHEIPQAVTHGFSGRRLQVFGLFLNTRTSVREIEERVARAPGDARGGITLAVDGADVAVRPLSVVLAR